MPTPIQNPAPFVPTRALAFADADGNSSQVAPANPLPVSFLPVATPALTGTTAVTGLIGPFQPAIGRPVTLCLSGNWSGTVKVLRSADGGITRLPLTACGIAWGEFSANCCEPVIEEYEAGATLYLDVTLTGGTLTYRLAQ